MSSTNTYSGSRRRPRRGGGQSQGRRGGSRPTNSPRQEAPKRAPKKLTLWEKVVAFFTGGAAEAAPVRPAPASTHERFEKTERPQRSERRSSERSEARTSRPPEPVEVTSPRVYVGNLSFDATESDLSDLFSGVGKVQNVEVVASKHTQRSKGFAFVQMQAVEEAKRAVEELHDKEFMGRKLVVSGAKALDERKPDRDRTARQPEQ